MVPGENSMLVPSQPVDATSESLVLCVVRDMTNSLVQHRFSTNLPAKTTVQKLYEEVGKNVQYDPSTFSMTYECPNGDQLEEVNLDDYLQQTLGNLCVNCGNNKRNNFSIMEKDGVPPTKLVDEPISTSLTDLSVGSSVSPVAGCENKTSHISNSYTSGDYTYSYASALIKSDTGYVGLVNQAMTCYLNSLLQTLFMTPEFRNALYRWTSEGDNQEKNIPYQLQKLFINLQTSTKRAIETTDITKSFGWDSSEAWQQHDVQELCRVMFDALEKKWKDTEQADLINRLYQGKMKDYVKCLECNSESAREDAYLDIPLVIRPFGASTAFASVEEALTAFVAPETLDGQNQYFCEKCNKKCNAHKGLKFVSFPYLLTLQLKRFDFDYNTMHRIKLNDRMSFPQILNLNHLIEDTDSKEASNGDAENQDEQDCSNHPAGASSPGFNGFQTDEGDDEGIDIGFSASGTSNSESSSLSSEAATNDKNAQDSKKRGPYEYELFSIMIHSGSAAGGHYYAYIKSFKDGQWYSFNDQHVSTITQEDIRKVYGGSSLSRSYYSSAYASSTNAYMLMYRQIDKERNSDFLTVEEFPPKLKAQLEELKNQAEEERRQKELERCTCKIKLFCFHPGLQKQLESRLEVHENKTLQEATEIAWKQMELTDIVPLDCVRLVKYDEFHDTLEMSYEGQEDKTMSEVLGGVKSTYSFDLLLELKRKDQKFQQYKPGGVTVKIYEVDLETETISPPRNVRAYLNQTVSEFKTLVAQMLEYDCQDMRCVLERYYNELKLIHEPTKTLKSEGFYRSNKVFIECSGEEAEVPFLRSKLYKILDRFENTIRIFITIPPEQKVEEMKPFLIQRTIKNDRVKNNSEDGSKSQEDDEGLGESESETRTRVNEAETPESDCLSSSDTSGPLRSSSTVSPDSVHSYIGDTIHKHNQNETNLDNTDDMPSSILSSATSSLKTSPDGQTVDFLAQGDEGPEEDWGKEADENLASMNMNLQSNNTLDKNTEEYRRYFSASVAIDTVTGVRSLTVYVDKRITLGELKKELEAFVGTSADNFKIYRVYGNNQECESTKLTENLCSFTDDSKLSVKLGRALRKGEYRVKVHQLIPNDPEPSKFLTESIIAKGMSVRESKEIILADIKTHCDLEISLDRCRLRKKTWKNPGSVYFDHQIFESDIQIFQNWDVFLEVLPGPEKMQNKKQLSLYVRQWFPSRFEVGPFEEVVLDETKTNVLLKELSAVSGISEENIEYAKSRGTFPCEVSVLEVHTDLEWNPITNDLNSWPLYICDDGNVIYYRDKTEELMELTDTKRKEIQQRENARLNRLNTRVSSYSPRKEKALKIYTDDAPSSSTISEVD